MERDRRFGWESEGRGRPAGEDDWDRRDAGGHHRDREEDWRPRDGYFEGRGDDWRNRGAIADRDDGLLHRVGQGLRHFWAERGPFFGKGPKGYQRSDDRIREEVSECIARQGWIDASDVEIAVESGEVILSGTVLERDHKRRLEIMIEDVPGVVDVRNQLRIRREDARSAGASPGERLRVR